MPPLPALLPLLLLPPLLAAPSPAAPAPAPELEERLRRSVTALSAPESRMTGYPGIIEAADWLTAELEAMGIGRSTATSSPCPCRWTRGSASSPGGSP